VSLLRHSPTLVNLPLKKNQYAQNVYNAHAQSPPHLAEQDELMPFLDMSMTVQFHAETQDPMIGQINENGPGTSISLLTITVS